MGAVALPFLNLKRQDFGHPANGAAPRTRTTLALPRFATANTGKAKPTQPGDISLADLVEPPNHGSEDQDLENVAEHAPMLGDRGGVLGKLLAE